MRQKLAHVHTRRLQRCYAGVSIGVLAGVVGVSVVLREHRSAITDEYTFKRSFALIGFRYCRLLQEWGSCRR